MKKETTVFPSPVGDYDSSLNRELISISPPRIQRFPSPVGDYDSSLLWKSHIVKNCFYLCFRPLSGIMILHWKWKLKKRWTRHRFPSPVGDYDSSQGWPQIRNEILCIDRFPSPVGDYDSSLCKITQTIYDCEDELFPSPVGDYDSSQRGMYHERL